jgi:hypothetical protein
VPPLATQKIEAKKRLAMMYGGSSKPKTRQLHVLKVFKAATWRKVLTFAAFLMLAACAFRSILFPRHAWVSGAVTSGNPHSSDHHRLQQWRSTLFTRTMNSYRLLEHQAGLTVEPKGHLRFSLFSPIIHCPSEGKVPQRFGGRGDGGKLICADMLLAAPGCTVYSLGSNNDYTFERSILDSTSCQVITFDCTVDGSRIDTRHTFVKKCIGSQKRADADPDKWTTLESAVLALGHKAIDLLKIDIEGAEYDVIGGWGAPPDAQQHLPRQIAMEIHYKDLYYGTPALGNASDVSNLVWPLHEMRLADLALFMMHLANMGYAIASREDNELCDHCTELTLILVT